MPASPSATAEHIKHVNTRYHDVAASSYDTKWGIDYGDVGQGQVRSKLVKALGREPSEPFGDSLEIGAGTGYFTLNLAQLGLIRRPTASDISEGMLAALGTTARRIGIDVSTVQAEAEQLPFDDAAFDLVFGHAVLHHIPDLDRAFSEFARVLRPGGVIVFCGEPSSNGDRLAALPKRAGHALAPLWRRAVGASEPRCSVDHSTHEHELEPEVNVHAFSPADLRAHLDRAGFEAPRIKGEELLANVWGWALRSLESTAEPNEVPMRWRRFAFRSYLVLQRADSALLEPRLPPQLFYNLMLSGRAPR